MSKHTKPSGEMSYLLTTVPVAKWHYCQA